MILVTIHLHASHNLLHLSINPDVQIPFTAHGLKEFAIVTFTASDEWSQDENLLAGIVAENHINHFLLRILHHLLTCGIAVSPAGTGKEQTHIVVDLSGGPNCRSRILVGRLLLDADDWRESGNLVYIRTLHSSKEITGVGREGLDIATLSFSKDGVESQ